MPVLLAVVSCAACTSGPEQPAASTTVVVSPPPVATSTPAPSLAEQIREWKARAGDHFTESAAALEQVSDAAAAEDDAGLSAGCQRLHDTNAIGLQRDLPTPDPRLTEALQKMIDDMNTATHACLRFVLGRDPREADTYQDYLARAVEHLRRAKVILSAAEK